MENNNAPLSPEKTTEASKPHSREPLFGVLLLVLISTLIFGFLAGLGWVGYSSWKITKEKNSQPSISGLGQEPSEAVMTPKEESKPTEEKKDVPANDQPDTLVKAKAADISVMNGGAAKGSAGTLAEALKKDGYLKVTAGNTLSDYVGTVIYFASGMDKEAEAVKASIIKSYPQATTKPALPANKETSVSPLTIILGK